VRIIRAFYGVIALLPLSVSGCSSANPRTAPKLNSNAALSGDFPANPLQWKVISLRTARAESALSTLHGNQLAVEYVRTHTQNDYPGGSELALVTWTQQEDPRWFGANIPGSVKSVEFVRVEDVVDGRRVYAYRRFEGDPLNETSKQDSGAVDARVWSIISQRAAVMP
jgi:hypothetical protein